MNRTVHIILLLVLAIVALVDAGAPCRVKVKAAGSVASSSNEKYFIVSFDVDNQCPEVVRLNESTNNFVTPFPSWRIGQPTDFEPGVTKNAHTFFLLKGEEVSWTLVHNDYCSVAAIEAGKKVFKGKADTDSDPHLVKSLAYKRNALVFQESALKGYSFGPERQLAGPQLIDYYVYGKSVAGLLIDQIYNLSSTVGGSTASGTYHTAQGALEYLHLLANSNYTELFDVLRNAYHGSIGGHMSNYTLNAIEPEIYVNDIPEGPYVVAMDLTRNISIWNNFTNSVSHRGFHEIVLNEDGRVAFFFSHSNPNVLSAWVNPYLGRLLATTPDSLFCNNVLANCGGVSPPPWEPFTYERCIELYAPLPLVNPSNLVANTKACRILHNEGLKVDPFHCPHVALPTSSYCFA